MMIKQQTYRRGQKLLLFTLALVLCTITLFAQKKANVLWTGPGTPAPRETFGITNLEQALRENGYTVVSGNASNAIHIRVGVQGSQEMSAFQLPATVGTPGAEGFLLYRAANNLFVSGADASGVLYGCLELAARIRQQHGIPAVLQVQDQPQMKLRGSCIGMQKPTYLPGHGVYEYPYTPETFPWFYNKQLWLQVLDSMVANRMNSLYLWNGHPFASLVKLKDYPYAVEVDDATFKKNEEIFSFLTKEADKRGIWVIQMFYNIIVSKPFAEHNHLKTQDRNRPIIPIIADYTRKSIAAFVEKYPNVGLMVCLGEAMQGTGPDDIEWFTKTIIPGVQDGLKALGRTEEPPIVLRAHDTDAPSVMHAALPLYKNLYTEAKFNGEALTTDQPRGEWAALHRQLSELGSVQIENVHIMANLEPFRYGAAGFIQRCVQGMHAIMGGNGLHLYPQASYWDWPYSADSTANGHLLQIERDWIWYKAWARYAWNCNRDPEAEKKYWAHQLAIHYGCSDADGANILEAYEQSGQIAPKLLRRFGITDGNRQTLTLGMQMTQLINPERYGLFTLLYTSESPVGEMLGEYAGREWNHLPHVGETPPIVIAEVRAHGAKAVNAIDAVKKVSRNKEEFARLKNDMYCYQALAQHYAFKAAAALDVLRYKYSSDLRDLDSAYLLLDKSVETYRRLVALTKGTYRYANSMQTQQRKIPFRGVDGTFKTWTEVLVPFEKELTHFRHAIDSLKQNPEGSREAIPLQEANVRITGNYARYNIAPGTWLDNEKTLQLEKVAVDLQQLNGIVLSSGEQQKSGTRLEFTSSRPVNVLVGFFNAKEERFLKAPELETNAGANDHGEADTKIARAAVVKGMPTVNIHSYSFPAGSNVLELPRGICLVLGFVNDDEPIHEYDAGLTGYGVVREVDWLFE